MLRQILTRVKPAWQPYHLARLNRKFSDNNSRDEEILKQDLNLTGVHFDEIDKLMCDGLMDLDTHYPNLETDPISARLRPIQGHNVVVIQPWVSYANFGESTDPELQLAECVSLGNTIHNWKVIGKKIIFANSFNRKQLVGHKAFDELKELVLGHSGITAVFFGVEILSGIQLATLEKELKIPVFDRFTVVLNIIRQHAKSKEAKLQLALAELPYIRSHLREIGESSDASSTDSLKLLVGGAGERSYFRRMNILKQREAKLKYLLAKVTTHRDVTKKLRLKQQTPLVSIVGYTNSGKTSLVKYLAQDEDLVPRNELFATLDVTVHAGQLPSFKTVMYVDTVGFISRIPMLLVEAFSATLKDIQDSDLIVHILDISHPDHKLQYQTVIKSLEALQVPRNLMKNRLTIGNKIDLINTEEPSKSLPTCELGISVTDGTNMKELADLLDSRLLTSVKYQRCTLRVENGGNAYSWLRRNSTIVECNADENDGNYLICRVVMSPASLGRWRKQYGAAEEIVEE